MTSSSSITLFLIGGHGKVALSLTRQAVQAGHHVISQIRNKAHVDDLPKPTAGATGSVTPLVESLESASVEHLSALFAKYAPNVVVFAAGAGGKGGKERTQAVDRDGAIKVMNAIEHAKLAQENSFRRFILLSAIDTRDTSAAPPSWYSQDDIKKSEAMRKALGAYMIAKYEADAVLSKRTSFPWFVLRPGTLLDDVGAGTVSLAQRGSISVPVPRDDVAATLLSVATLPRGQADGMMWDLNGGEEVKVAEAVKQAVEQNRTDWVG